MKRAKKGLAALLSICMLVTFLPASALAIGPEVGAEGLDEEAVAPVEEETEPVGEPAEPDNGAYSALKQAIEAASDGKETTVTLAGDIARQDDRGLLPIWSGFDRLHQRVIGAFFLHRRRSRFLQRVRCRSLFRKDSHRKKTQ